MSLSLAIRHQLARIELDLSFRTDASGITALFGPSGAGKTSIINAVAGLLRPDWGQIQIGEHWVLDTQRSLDVATTRRRVGYVFQDARLFPHLSIRGNLLYGWKRSQPRAPIAERERMIETLGLAPLLDARPADLSGGEKQRVAIGRALLSSPSLLLLDEPMTGLDHKRRDDVLPYLEKLRDERGVPMLYVSHSVDEVARLADQVLVLDQGHLAAAGPVDEIFSRIDLFPLTGRFEAGAVLHARIERHDADTALSVLRFDGGVLSLPYIDAALNSTVRLRIRARDVLLASTPPQALSTTNVLTATVNDLRTDPGPFADVQLRCGSTTLVARVTREALGRMQLAPGVAVYAIIKPEAITPRVLRG